MTNQEFYALTDVQNYAQVFAYQNYDYGHVCATVYLKSEYGNSMGSFEITSQIGHGDTGSYSVKAEIRDARYSYARRIEFVAEGGNGATSEKLIAAGKLLLKIERAVAAAEEERRDEGLHGELPLGDYICIVLRVCGAQATFLEPSIRPHGSCLSVCPHYQISRKTDRALISKRITDWEFDLFKKTTSFDSREKAERELLEEKLERERRAGA